METTWIIITALFLLIIFLYWKISKEYFKNEVFSEGTWKNWVTRLYYWQGAIFISGAVTATLIFLFKRADILNF